MDLLMAVLFPVLFIIALVAVMSKKSKGYRKRILFFVLGVPFLIFSGDEYLGRAVLAAACAVDGGIKVHESAVANSYYMTTKYSIGCYWECRSALTREGFKYFEVASDRGEVLRFFLADSGSPACLKGEPTQGKCVASETLPEPKSRYWMSSHYLTKWDRPFLLGYWPISLQRSQLVVKDMERDKVMGVVTAYRHAGGWVSNLSLGLHSPSTCRPSGWHEVFEQILYPRSY